MSEEKLNRPDYIFEVSWEVCNKVGGIHTVISTKAEGLTRELEDNYILIGPDVWKETHENPEFIEDKFLYRAWCEQAESDGFHFRIGRWNTAGNPVVILVDFTTYFPNKNKIFAHFWESCKLDSISGQWDYIEPALFGYAAARIIESFYDFNMTGHNRIIAHFHEWMTGTGILYLKEKVPQAATVFTTHATVLGRSIAGNRMPLYSELKAYDPELVANNLGVKSKYSLEHLSATESDAFTTVSQITAEECKYLLRKEVDVITPNGFDDSFIPQQNEHEKKRNDARNKIIEVTSTLLNQEIPSGSLLVINSGRYEFRNKGIDLYIDALGKINRSGSLQRKVIAFIAVPANHTGPDPDLMQRMLRKENGDPLSGKYLTHGLWDPANDIILKRIHANGLNNSPDDQVKIIFVPSYLNGRDGVFNMDYYDFLIGFDVSVFPSYYEPWGYTPLESLAYSIPSVTSSLSGFGMWIHEKFGETLPGADVVERNEVNDAEVTDKIKNRLENFLTMPEDEWKAAREKAFQISRTALWKNIIEYYHRAYSIALAKAGSRYELYRTKQPSDLYITYRKITPARPEWRKILVNPSVPEKFMKLQELAWNLWWSWNHDAIELFESIDPALWKEFGNNPIALLESLTIEQFANLEENEVFLEKLEGIYTRFRDYMEQGEKRTDPLVAYFSMEYGIHSSLKIYSGGLGILAGDYLKQASDSNKNLVGIGLIYRYGYFTQGLSLFGDQLSSYLPMKFSHIPLKPARNTEGEWIKVSLALPGRVVYAKVWKVDVGRISLYLMDADITDNNDNDRTITHQLYGGDNEMRFKQELLLGVGGIRMLDALDIHPDVFHINEGHAAFIGLERMRKLVQEQKFTFAEASDLVSASALFTTHTPVAAGHDMFDEDLLRTYIPHYADRLGISWDTFMNLGKMHQDYPGEKFSMSVLAARLSQEMNGVSKIHEMVTREMFNAMWEGYFPDELPIGHITNGVHYYTWTSADWQILHHHVFGESFSSDHSNPEYWKKIYDVADEEIWETKQKQRRHLINYLKERIKHDLTLRQENPKLIFQILETLDDNTLTIGFARRFATYKRAHLLFANLERLSGLLNNKERPVQFIFAGKAHPRDKEGQDLIKRIIEISKQPEFIGKIIFVENYEMDLAKQLIPGVDVWLNTPTRPLEASGTSGQKAALNGVINLSVLDGWWAEGYEPGAGFAVPEARTYANQQFQDELDAEIIYNILEDEIIPLFYNRNKNNVPQEWVRYIKNTIADVAPHYTMKRMLDEYYDNYYFKLNKRYKELTKDNYFLSGKIASWKRRVLNAWDNMAVVEVNVPDSTIGPLTLGKTFSAEVILDINELNGDDVGMEILFGQKENDRVNKIIWTREMKMTKLHNDHVKFTCKISMEKAGVYDYIFRVYPKNPLLPYRQSLNLVMWI